MSDYDVRLEPQPCARCGRAGWVPLRYDRGVYWACGDCAGRAADKVAAAIERRRAGSFNTQDGRNGQGTHRAGFDGELVFGARYGLPVDMREQAAGDRGRDFHTRIGTIDVKTWRVGTLTPELHVQVGLNDGRPKERADAYVLALHRGRAELAGWAWRETMEDQPIKEHTPIGAVYWLALERLNTIPQLDDWLEPKVITLTAEDVFGRRVGPDSR